MHIEVLDRLKNGQNVYGTCITSTGPMWPSAVKRAGLDFVFIDTEHIPLGRPELATLCQQFRNLSITPIVRIPCPDPFLACQAIDCGAKGIVAPYLESTDQVLELVGAVKYRPLKGELLQGYLKGNVAMPSDLQAYIVKFNTGNICIANIESVPARDKLDSLLSVPGLDAVFIGPHDLSVSMGLPEQYDHPEFERAVTHIIHMCRAKGLAVGIHFSLEPERQIKWMKEGANIVVHSFDIALFTQKLTYDMNIIREAAGEKTERKNEPGLIV